MCHLRAGENLERELLGKLPPQELQALLSATHRPNFTVQVGRGGLVGLLGGCGSVCLWNSDSANRACAREEWQGEPALTAPCHPAHISRAACPPLLT